MTTEWLLEREARTRAEADALVADLRLDPALSAIGSPTRVGGYALRVMVRRDVDITVTCPALDRSAHAAVARLGADLAQHPRVREVRLRDDTGHWNTDPAYPDGLYLHVVCQDGGGRAAVLGIKHEQAARSGDRAAGFDVYRAVLDHGVRTPEQFAAWRARG